VAGVTVLGQFDGMTPDPATYPGYRFPSEIISHAVWLYHVFSLSLRVHPGSFVVLAELSQHEADASHMIWFDAEGSDSVMA
jgi:hypothetical protein